LNPFDLKAALLARHAQHVVLIHFPIALFLASVVFDVAAHCRRNPALRTVSYYNLWAAAICAVPALLTGILAWQWQLGGAHLKGNLLLHLVLGCLSSVLIWLVLWLRVRDRRAGDRRNPAYSAPSSHLPLELIAAVVIAFTAHVGGILSGVNAPV
jgi:uncharacterized membrane protein